MGTVSFEFSKKPLSVASIREYTIGGRRVCIFFLFSEAELWAITMFRFPMVC